MTATATKTRKFSTTIRSTLSGHKLFVETIDRSALPAHVAKEGENWTTFYTVKNFDAKGFLFFYLAKGYRHPSPEYANDPAAHAPKQITAIYCNGEMWSGFGETLTEAVEGAQRNGWLYTGAR